MGIKNIIFDLCGPIIEIDIQWINQMFMQYGVSEVHSYECLHKAKLTHRFEMGALCVDDFCMEVCDLLHTSLTQEQILHAWNNLIVDLPERHLTLLQELKQHYRLFLLSNSDIVNAKHFTEWINQRAGYNWMEEVFEHAYFSYSTGMRKPDPAIFQHILQQHGLLAAETLFIDDNLKHVNAAQTVGIQAIHLKEGSDIQDLFDSQGVVSLIG